MASKKTLVTALRPFSHGNVDARQGGVYAMNAGDAKELEKAGFVSMEATGEPEQTQLDATPQKKQAGDVVVDDAEDVLGGSKAEQAHANKMEPAAPNKAAGKTTK